jgi:YD repeat-containing protein
VLSCAVGSGAEPEKSSGVQISSYKNRYVEQSQFWHRSAWKWGLFLVLVGCSAFLLLWKPARRPVKVELLPFADLPPAWNGSYPYLVISPLDLETDPAKFRSSILLVQPTVRHDSPINGFEVDLHSGMFVLRQTDLFVSDVMALSLTRTYRGWDFDRRARAFGAGTNHPYDICPTGSRFPYTYMDLNLEDGRQIHFLRISKGTGYADAVFRHGQTSSEFYGAQIAWNGDGWTLNFRDGRRWLFPEAYYSKTFAQGAPFEMQAADGHRIQLKRDNRRRLKQLISPSGHTISFEYDGADRIIDVRDDAGNVRKYSYDSNDHLATVADAAHVLYRFEYAPLLHSAGYDPYLMTAVVDGRGKVLLQNIYNDSDGGRISEQRLANGDVYRYEYILVKQEIVETVVSDPTGRRKYFFQRGRFTKEE